MAPFLSFRLPGRVRRRGALFITACPTLDVWSQGRTPAEARRNLADAVASFLESCWRRGTLDEVLRACGWGPRRRPRPVKADFTFEVPVAATYRAAA